ncbi:hypothetical protein ACFLXT_01325 [Chloroflexota bacterium]
MSDRVTIKIPRELYQKLALMIEGTGFSSVRSASELLIQIRVRNKLQVLVSGDLSGVG